MAVFPGYALIVGVGTYDKASNMNVPMTAEDARQVAALLVDPRYCAYPQGQVTLLTDADATRQSILDALDKLAENAGEDATVLLFYSGHGLFSDENFYLATYDTEVVDGKMVPDTGVRESELLERLNAVKAQRAVMIFNACHSGAIEPASLGEQPASSAPTGATLPERLTAALLGTGEGRVVITACKEKQSSYFVRNAETTLFTQALLDTLQGRGLDDRHGLISVFDLYAYVYSSVNDEVKRRWGLAQDPVLTIHQGVGVMAVAAYQGRQPQGNLGSQDRPEHLGGATREVNPHESAEALKQILTGTVNLAVGRDITGNTIVGGSLSTVSDEIDARGSQGFVNHPSGPAPQAFGERHTINTGGGGYAEGSVHQPHFGVLGIGDDEERAPTVPKSPPATAGLESVTSLEQRRLEAAMPRSARVDLPTEIRTMVSLPGSEGLRKELPALTKSGELIARNDVAGHDVLVAFENAQWTTLYLELVAPDFDIDQPILSLRVPRSGDSGVATFFVTPRRARTNGRVVVNLFQDAARHMLLDSLTLMVDIKGRNFTMFFEEVWQIVISTVSNEGPARQGFAMAGVRQQVVYMNVQNQTVVQGDQYNSQGNMHVGDNIDARNSEGFNYKSTGPMSQVFGGQRNVNTGGGDYAEGNIDKRQGAFVSGGSVYGAVAGTNAGEIGADYRLGSEQSPQQDSVTLQDVRRALRRASDTASDRGDSSLVNNLDEIEHNLSAAIGAEAAGNNDQRAHKLYQVKSDLTDLVAHKPELQELVKLFQQVS